MTDEGLCPRWGIRTRCAILEDLLYVATILGRTNGRLKLAAAALPVCILLLPLRFIARGIFIGVLLARDGDRLFVYI